MLQCHAGQQKLESARFLSAESQENGIFRHFFDRPGERNHQTEM